MSGLSGVSGGFNPAAWQQFQQSLFSQIDQNGDGSISQTELEQAVTNAGGSTQAADALYSLLDPNNSGGVSEQQFAQVLPAPSMSDGMQAQMIGYQAQGWPGATDSSGSSLAQNLFSQIDTSGTGSITQSQLEQAVTNAGGTKAAADALWAKVDPSGAGSVTEQQFAQGLSQAVPHGGGHHHHHGGGALGSATDTDSASDGSSADDALTALFQADSGGADNSPTQIAQNIFSSIDTSGTGSITQTELENAVTAAGGTTAGADALYTQLDSNGTGSVSEQQFVSALQPPSPSGNTASDALLALLEATGQTNASATGDTATTNGGSGSTTGTTSASNGNTAQDALTALLQNIAPTPSTASDTGNSAQDALLALLNGGGNATNSTNSATTLSNADLANAFALYQNQLSQQVLTGVGGPQSVGIA